MDNDKNLEVVEPVVETQNVTGGTVFTLATSVLGCITAVGGAAFGVYKLIKKIRSKKADYVDLDEDCYSVEDDVE